MTRLLWLALLGGLAFSGGANQSNHDAAVAADSVTVAMRTFQFRPQQVHVNAGTRVVWSNEDEIDHTATSGSAEARDSLFDLALAHKGARAEFTFTKPGTFAYFCAKHPFMRGEIHVTLKGDTP